jgi:hypothetical protein
MSAKVKNTIIILVIMVLIALTGGLFNYAYLRGKINDREKKINDLKMYQMDTESLVQQLAFLKKRVAELDSILANRKYNIPYNLSQSAFFDFVNQVSYSFSNNSFVNIEYNESETTPHFNIYHFTLTGSAEFKDFMRLVYAIEESKLLKKVSSIELTNSVKVEEDGVPYYLVNFKFKASVYSSEDDRFYVKEFKENSLEPNPSYDIFYPLVRNEIPPNSDGLLDVQNASLLALIPDGAFLSDANGNTFLLWEGDKVYLGYLTNINYQKNEVSFVLNKGGIIETIALKLAKEKAGK